MKNEERNGLLRQAPEAPSPLLFLHLSVYTFLSMKGPEILQNLSEKLQGTFFASNFVPTISDYLDHVVQYSRTGGHFIRTSATFSTTLAQSSLNVARLFTQYVLQHLPLHFLASFG